MEFLWLKLFLRKFLVLGLPILIPMLLFVERLRKKKFVTVLIFHDIPESDYKKFNKVIGFFYKRFSFITPTQFDLYMKGKLILEKSSYLVTFDDGFRSSKDAAEKFLDPLGIKAIFFCCSNFIGLNNEQGCTFVNDNFYPYQHTKREQCVAEAPMSIEDVLSLYKNGHDIGGHSVTHVNLTRLITEELKEREIGGCVDFFKKKLNIDLRMFAYPFGGISFIDNKSAEIIYRYYEYCFSGVRGNVRVSDTGRPLPRQCVTLQDNYWLQIALVLGLTNVLHYFKRKKLRKIGAR